MTMLIASESLWAQIPEFDESRPYLLHPYVTPERLMTWQESLPPGEVCIRRGARVQAFEGKVGWKDDFVVIPTHGEIPHLLLREGHFWGRKELAIPVSAVERIKGRTAHLKLDKKGVRALPSVPVQEPWR